jgi:threonine aldolase
MSTPDKKIDLRSDTVTHPTPAMRAAMAKAEVGDDVLEEDPSVNRLQEMAAERMGKEAGLFVPSGTMGNLAAVLTHCGRGDEAIMGDLGHTFLFEGGGISALGGVFAHILPNLPNGTIEEFVVERAVRSDDVHHPISRLIILENTHNRCGGVPISLEYTNAIGALARKKGLILHLDGARIFNAEVALGVDAADLAAMADSVTFCLSKGLCAPVGSVLCGKLDFIKKARRIRKQLGGGMRQAGILAAAGIVALETMTGRLGEDHLRAQNLAEGLVNLPGLELTFGKPATNILFLTLSDPNRTAKGVAERLKNERIFVGVVGEGRFRLVTHYWIDDQDVKDTIRGFEKVLQSS